MFHRLDMVALVFVCFHCALSMVLIPAVQVYPVVADPCTTYTELNDAHRSVNYTRVDGSDICDDLLTTGWYRFTSAAGGEMPESCVPLDQCNTVAPVWMDGSHVMNVGDVVDRTACINMGVSCCDHSLAIKVKKCSSFFVYYLGPTPGCPTAYCAGSRAPCPAGQSSSDGFPPCEEVYPVMTTDPTFEGPIVMEKEFTFTCQVNYDGTLRDPDLRFEVEWTFDGQPGTNIPSEELTDPSTVVVLDGSMLKGNLDHLVRCRVRAWFTNRTLEVKSPWRVSGTSYYAGFRLNPASLDVTPQTPDQTLTVETTVPIVCSQRYSTNSCCIYIHLDVDGQKGVLTTSTCKYQLCSRDWDNVTQTASVPM